MTGESLRRHYEIERELADRLRQASSEERRRSYAVVYDELFARVPDHPQLTRRADAAEQMRAVDGQLRILERFLTPTTRFLEIGAGDLALTRRVADRVSHVTAVEVSEAIVADAHVPEKVSVVISDGVSVGVPDESVDLAYSNQVMEHLHPDDAAEQLGNIGSALVAGGRYVFLTPHRLSGPHDVSRWFDDAPTGFHLREYGVRELLPLLRDAGFGRVQVLVGGKGRYAVVPAAAPGAIESLVELIPSRGWQRRAVRSRALRPLFLLGVVATKRRQADAAIA